MFETKDYSKLTLEELLLKEKKMKSYTILVAFLCGSLMGVAVWAATHKWGFFKTVMMMAFSFFIGNKYSQALKDIKAEISSRNKEN